MSKVDKETIKHLGVLSKIAISDKLSGILSDQLTEVLTHFEQLDELNLDNVKPYEGLQLDSNVLRDDIVEKSMPVDLMLKNAPDVSRDHYKVPKILESS